MCILNLPPLLSGDENVQGFVGPYTFSASSPTNLSKPTGFLFYSSHTYLFSYKCACVHVFMQVVPSLLNFLPIFLCIAPGPILRNTQFQSRPTGELFLTCLLLSPSRYTHTPHIPIYACRTVWETCYALAYYSIIGYSFLSGSCQTMGSSREEVKSLEPSIVHSTHSTLNK